MIEAVAQWVKNLIFLVLLAAFMELLLPTRSMRKFLRVVIGLLVMLAILQPAAAFFESVIRREDVPVLRVMQQRGGREATPSSGADQSNRLTYSIYRRALARQIQATVETLPEVAAAQVEVLLCEAKRVHPMDEIQHVAIAVRVHSVSRERKIEVRLHETSKKGAFTASLRNRILSRVSELHQIPAAKIEINEWK